MFPQQPVLNWLQITDPENISRKKCHYFFKPFAQLNIVENVFLLFSEITVVTLELTSAPLHSHSFFFLLEQQYFFFFFALHHNITFNKVLLFSICFAAARFLFFF